MTVRQLALLFAACSVAAPASAAVWPVSENAKLQETIDSAAYGDTVLVAPGTYKRVVLRNGIRVISEKGPAETLIKHNTYWVVEGEGVDSLASIEGFSIDGVKGAEGVVYAKDSHFMVRNCTMRGGWSGVRALYSDLRVEGCAIRECTNGIYVFESGGVLIENDIQLCHTGMMIVSSNPRVLKNAITRNSVGLSVEQHSDPQIGGTIATANRIWNNRSSAVKNDSQIKEKAIRTMRPKTLSVSFNFWGSDCPDSTLFRGLVAWAPWVDESGTRSLEKCAKSPPKK
jgi:hypothetical protein